MGAIKKNYSETSEGIRFVGPKSKKGLSKTEPEELIFIQPEQTKITGLKKVLIIILAVIFATSSVIGGCYLYKNFSDGGNRMKKIGMMVATVREMEAAIKKYGEAKKEEEHGMIKVWTYEMPDYTLYLCNSGWGEIAAAGAAQLLISSYNVDVIVNYGVVGALTTEMAVKEPCVVSKVVHYDFDVSPLAKVEPGQYEYLDDVFIRADKNLIDKALAVQPNLKQVVCASADKFVAAPEDKQALHDKYGADICEMEAAGILLTCVRNDVPCLLIKSVSDSVTGGEKEFNAMVQEASVECIEIVNEIVKEL